MCVYTLEYSMLCSDLNGKENKEWTYVNVADSLSYAAENNTAL